MTFNQFLNLAMEARLSSTFVWHDELERRVRSAANRASIGEVAGVALLLFASCIDRNLDHWVKR